MVNEPNVEQSTYPIPPSHGTKHPSSGPWFSFNNIPPAHMHILSAWIDNQMTIPVATMKVVLTYFTAHFTGSLSEWFKSFDAYRQLQLIRVPTAEQILGTFQQFIGDPTLITTQARNEYFMRRCCSLMKKDLDHHYEKMSPLFYILYGTSKPTIKQVYISSLCEKIHHELQELLLQKGTFKILHLGKYIRWHGSLRKAVWTTTILQIEKTCYKPYLQIKCNDKTCDCRIMNSSHSKKWKSYNPWNSKKKSSRKTRFFKRKNNWERNKSTKCFNCGK
ncbi:hypothetical protein FNV43_RR10315 [Rhamnella rubrinervis]|uniref:Uncharacterized protein n=1 Tax=Rhamnella rubrinervis TaxID=2594499 RepID=A0A8K0MKL0_9ROSA|nr:hypothetical protein FNV43_RR10315 [Rhamnella rubrinervis]